MNNEVFTLVLTNEITASIREAIEVQALFNSLPSNDIRWYAARNQLRSFREEIGAQVIWQLQEDDTEK